MKGKKTLLVLALVIGVMALGIGYAALSDIVLNIGGGANAEASTDNWTVKFTGVPATSGDGTTTATITNDKTATISVTGLQNEDEAATATYTISNTSTGIGATLAVNTSWTDHTNWNVVCTPASSTIAAGASTTLTCTVTLLTQPGAASITEENISVQITATPTDLGE